MYYREPRSPSPQEEDTIRHITHLAGVAIERKLAESARRQSEAYLEEAQRLSHTGSWAWAPATGEIRYWSDEAYRMLGFDPHAGAAAIRNLLSAPLFGGPGQSEGIIRKRGSRKSGF